MGLGKVVRGSFRRSSSVICLIILVAFTTMILSTAYHMLAFAPAEFVQKPEVQEYENAVENISVMDKWTRTQYYWSNNLRVAGVCVVGTPTYFGFNSAVATNYMVGMSLTYIYHIYGPKAMLVFTGQIFMHGLLELTGIYIIAAISLRVAWNIWKGLGGLTVIAGKEGKHWSWKLTRGEKREIAKHKGTIKLLLSDFITLFVIGAFFVFLAAPIEAYISPEVGSIFFAAPVLAAAFLVVVGLIYGYVVARGFNAMRRDLKFVWKEMISAFKGKWRPAQLSLLTFMTFFVLMLLRILL